MVQGITRNKRKIVEFCRKHGLEFFAINKSHPDEVFNGSMSRKIYADIYIDGRNIGGFPGWSAVWQMLNPYELEQKEAEKKMAASRINIFKRLFSRKNLSNEN